MSAADGYELVRHLGMGLGSAVYLAETGSGQIAIRQFVSQSQVGTIEWREERDYFLKSARLALPLKHPNIVPVLEVIDEGGEAFVSMEYESAPTLQAEIAKKEFELAQANSVLRQVSRALDFAHAQGVIHGDLKPSDIFLLPDGTVRLSGFAISARARQDPKRSLGANFLHPYLTPEHVVIPMVLGPSSDQYALGVIAYRLYTGTLPYPDNADLRNAILTEAVAPPSAVQRKLPRGGDAPILRALERDPINRFPSCSDFVTALGTSMTSQADASQRRWSSSVLYAALAALAVLIAYIVWSDSRPAPSATRGRDQATGVKPPQPQAKTDSLPGGQHAPAQESVRAQPTLASNTEPKQAVKPRQGETNPATRGVSISAKGEQQLTAQARSGRRDESHPETIPTRNSDTNPAGPEETAASRSVVSYAREFSIDVYSRTTSLTDGISFAFGDPKLGELAQGDLKAIVQYDGVPQPRKKLMLEWSIDEHPMDKKTVQANQLVEYGNEPTAGYYRVRLLVDGREAKTFSFRITP